MNRLFTFGIVAHIDAGKTTLTERILHDTGAQSWVGSVEQGTAATDWMPQERSRGISIGAAVTRVSWAGATLQVVDTPGHVDFTAEVERCLFVLDGVVVVVDGLRGVESQTEVVWRQADDQHLPRLVFLNKLDRTGADYDAVLRELRTAFDCRLAPLVVPFRDAAGSFAGLGHALTGAVQWFAGQPDAAVVPRILAELHAARDALVEELADCDEKVMAAVVEGLPLSVAELQQHLAVAVRAGRLIPVLAGAALFDRGIDWLLDAVVALLPGVADLPASGLWATPRALDRAAPMAALVFKVQHADAAWNYLRVVRGELRPQDVVAVAGRPAASFQVPALWVMQADRHREVQLALPGEIVVVPGEFGLRTGDTLAAVGQSLALPTPRFPAPVLAVTIEPGRAEDAPRLLAGLRQLAVDDPTLRVQPDRGQIVVRGMGELHLEIVADLLRAKVPVPFQQSRPRVDRREVVAGSAVAAAELRATVAGRERSARCRVEVAALADPASSSVVGTELEDGDVAVAAALAVLRERLLNGPAGPLVGSRLQLLAAAGDADGVVEALVQQAAARALQSALETAGCRILEPWVAVEVWCPEASCAAVLADLGSRGAQLHGVAAGRLGARLQGKAPLERMLGYVTRLRSITKGLGRVVMRPLEYAVQP